MRRKFMPLNSALTLVLLCMSCIAGNQAWAASEAIELEKAKLVSKFAKYVVWPSDDPKSTFTIAVYRDEQQYQNFSKHFKNKGVHNKDIVVRQMKEIGGVRNIDILFIPANEQQIASAAFKRFRSSGTLIISENSRKLNKAMVDISYGNNKPGIALKIFEENLEKVQFTVPELTYLLGDSTNATLPDGPTFVLQSQQEEEVLTLKGELAKQKEELALLNRKLDKSAQTSEKNKSDLQAQAQRLKLAKQQNLKQNQELKQSNDKLKNLEERLKLNQRQLQEEKAKQTQQAQQPAPSLAQGAVIPPTTTESIESIESKEKMASDFAEQLRQKDEIISKNKIALAEMLDTTDNQFSFKIPFYIASFIAVFMLIILVIARTKVAKKSASPALNNSTLLSTRESQLIKSENLAALGYLATDITYETSMSLDDLKANLRSSGDVINTNALGPVISTLENFNAIAADQDDTEIQKFDIAAYSRKVMTLFSAEFSQSDINYHYSGQEQLIVNSVPSYIALILLNIVNNSLKHGFDNNGNGNVALTIDKGEQHSVQITYSDTGKGMSQTILEQVFTPFFTTRSDRGYIGLGMSNTYQLITSELSGTININSEEGQGTTVVIQLP